MSNELEFILSDESVANSYGFHVLTEGINLQRFNSNPVMLNNHRNDTKDVLGSWKDLRKENGKLYAKPDFDTEDNEGKEVVRKVQRGKIKGASVGIIFKKEAMQLQNGKLVLTECELLEASIVAVPSNAHAITLYHAEGKPYTEAEIQALCLSVHQNSNLKFDNTMNKEILSLLKLADNANEDAVKEAIKDTIANLSAVTADRDQLKTEVTNLREAQTQRQTAEFSAELERAIKDGRIDADGAEPVKELQKANHAQAMKLLAGLKPHASVNDQINKGDSASELAKLSWDELDKQGKLAYLKANDFTLYAEKFKAKFGKEPNAN
ncbi:HK97 family phage prohead protease [Capnocytophaga felis]|uniref:Prohead serine protease domain-containing protein n=1 Tax=Capnocytophaga felis TaxID=2267611 RepID=A0A5M4BA66_9FLAO|nr:HK97 family phage prohead protease [Capnocytophaga felis]GET46493.1 hypothetical protein RCZ01_17950 [Capnocytophaga felis]GET48383.1 hypothetical protein RCZ02_12140 [Capnocytophaga felis]